VERSREMLQKCVLRSSPSGIYLPDDTTAIATEGIEHGLVEWTTVTCVPPLAVRAFIRRLRTNTEYRMASTEPAYSISRSHSPTRSGHTNWMKPARERLHRGAPEVRRAAHLRAAIASKLLFRQPFTFMKTFNFFHARFNGLFIGTLAHADVVTDWNTAALDAIRAGHTRHHRLPQSCHSSRLNLRRGQWYRSHARPYLVQSAVRQRFA